MKSGDRELATAVAFIGIAAMAGFIILSAIIGEGFAIPVGIIGTIGAAVVLRGPLGKAIARRLEGGQPAQPPEEIYGELDELRNRLMELEERQDFSERLLSQRSREPAES